MKMIYAVAKMFWQNICFLCKDSLEIWNIIYAVKVNIVLMIQQQYFAVLFHLSFTFAFNECV